MFIKRIIFFVLCFPFIILMIISHNINNRTIYGLILSILISIGSIIFHIIENRKYKLRLRDYQHKLDTLKTSSTSIIEQKDSEIEAINKKMIDNQNEYCKLKENIEKYTNLIQKREKIIPVLIEQLKAVIQYTDKSAEDLISSFININQKTKQHTKDVSNIYNLNNDNSDNEQSMLRENKNILTLLLANTEESLELSKNIASKIQNIIEEYNSIQSIISIIQNIADQTKIISLNALIESTRVKSNSRGFSVVAKEMKRLSEESSKTTNKIEKKVTQLIQSSTSTFKETENEIDRISTISKHSEATMLSSMKSIDEYLAFLKDKFLSISHYTNNLAHDITRIVVSIQFQDITRQRIEHIIKPLELLLEEEILIKCHFSEFIKDEDAIDTVSIQNWLNQFYTMEDEKQILNEILK